MGYIWVMYGLYMVIYGLLSLEAGVGSVFCKIWPNKMELGMRTHRHTGCPLEKYGYFAFSLISSCKNDVLQ